ncbi:unnamed protein product [Allacma fusca]|uniref:Uncharacterized protein n=1 Tax=Allacma fusca TaxID=39272 RepID=A0A8J2KB33_9HEXA|nr:unnamed protein product [Allacma fusca]
MFRGFDQVSENVFDLTPTPEWVRYAAGLRLERLVIPTLNSASNPALANDEFYNFPRNGWKSRTDLSSASARSLVPAWIRMTRDFPGNDLTGWTSRNSINKATSPPIHTG